MTLKYTPPPYSGRYALAYGSYFKVYDSLGAVKNAYHQAGANEMFYILERVGNDWYILYQIKPDVLYGKLPWIKPRQRGYPRHRAVPMSPDEYAEWRLKVQLEKLQEDGLLRSASSGNLPTPGEGIVHDDDEERSGKPVTLLGPNWQGGRKPREVEVYRPGEDEE